MFVIASIRLNADDLSIAKSNVDSTRPVHYISSVSYLKNHMPFLYQTNVGERIGSFVLPVAPSFSFVKTLGAELTPNAHDQIAPTKCHDHETSIAT